VIDRLLPIVLSFAVGVALAVFCAFCVANPERISDYARRRYLRSSKLVQKWPFSNIVMKTWYRTYIRIWGLFGLAVGLGFIVISVFIAFLAGSK
jgi:hypothetical protein